MALSPLWLALGWVSLQSPLPADTAASTHCANRDFSQCVVMAQALRANGGAAQLERSNAIMRWACHEDARWCLPWVEQLRSDAKAAGRVPRQPPTCVVAEDPRAVTGNQDNPQRRYILQCPREEADLDEGGLSFEWSELYRRACAAGEARACSTLDALDVPRMGIPQFRTRKKESAAPGPVPQPHALSLPFTPRPTPPGSQVISGVVMQDGHPVQGAQITFRDVNTPQNEERSKVHANTTDASGRFTIPQVPAHDWLVFATAEGTTRASAVWRARQPGELTLTLRPGSWVTGNVVNEKGLAVAGARVQAIEGKALWSESTTDAQGRFTLGGVRGGSGSVRLSVVADHPTLGAGATQVVVKDLGATAATVVMHPPKDPRNVMFRLVTEGGKPVVGSVTVNDVTRYSDGDGRVIFPDLDRSKLSTITYNQGWTGYTKDRTEIPATGEILLTAFVGRVLVPFSRSDHVDLGIDPGSHALFEHDEDVQRIEHLASGTYRVTVTHAPSGSRGVATVTVPVDGTAVASPVLDLPMTLRLHVVDGQTHAPIVAARVGDNCAASSADLSVLAPWDDAGELTDPDGNLVMTRVVPGPQRLAFAAKGWVDRCVSFSVVTNAEHQVTQEVVLWRQRRPRYGTATVPIKTRGLVWPGMELAPNAAGLRVVSVDKDGPMAGLLEPEDVISVVNGTDTRNVAPSQVTTLLEPMQPPVITRARGPNVEQVTLPVRQDIQLDDVGGTP